MYGWGIAKRFEFSPQIGVLDSELIKEFGTTDVFKFKLIDDDAFLGEYTEIIEVAGKKIFRQKVFTDSEILQMLGASMV